MSFLLDTNVPSELMRDAPDRRVISWTASRDDLYMSVISSGEIQHGIRLLPEGRRRQEIEDRRQHVLLPLIGNRLLPITKSIADR